MMEQVRWTFSGRERMTAWMQWREWGGSTGMARGRRSEFVLMQDDAVVAMFERNADYAGW
jgi:hypothetical protein